VPGHRLITIPISHFCEKARWALDRTGLSYTEEPHLQGIHVGYALRHGRSRTVPVLVCADGTVLTESAAIVRWCDGHLPPERRLYPDGTVGEAAAGFEAGFDGGLGPDGRLWLYHATLPAMDALAPSILAGTPGWERRVFASGQRILDPFIRRYLGVSEANAVAAMGHVTATFDTVAECLSDGRRYLCGDRFTAADLAFAALAAPVLVPHDYGSPLPVLDELPDAMAADIARLRAHPAGAFALRVYADERRTGSHDGARSDTAAES